MRLNIFSSVSFLVLAIATPFSANAAFQFVPTGATSDAAPAADTQAPAAAPAIAPSAPIESAPLPAPVRSPDAATSGAVPLTPVISNSDALAIETRPYSERHPDAAAMPAPIRHVVDNLAPVATMPDSPAAISDNEGSVVEGFGRDVPLAIALQQIVPPSYRYSFEKPLNPSTKISWTGGKPWKEVIADVARSNDMNVDIASNVVSFSRHTPMDMIADSSAIDSSNSVQGIPMKLLPGQQPAVSSAPAPITDSFAPPPAPTGNVHDIVYDSPIASNTSAAAPSSSRKALGSISDLNDAQATPPTSLPPVASSEMSPPPAMPAPVAAPLPPAVPAANEKSAFFDGMMDNGAKSPNNAVQEKKILTADNKPVDILDHISVASPVPSHTDTTSKDQPKPVDSVPMPVAPLPAAPRDAVTATNMPTDLTKRVDNPPVTSNDLPSINNAADSTPAGVSPMPQSDLTTSKDWEGRKGETLRQTLTNWSEQAGVSLVWSSEYDFPLQTDIRIQAAYADGVRTLLAGFSKAQPRPIGRLFKNDKVGAQPVLIIETQRLTN